MFMRRLTLVLLGSISAYAFAATAQAADLILDPTPIVDQGGAMLPAVSGVNGKWEITPGLADGGAEIRGAGSLSVPLGDRFGVQADIMGSWNSATGYAYGGALHAFTRDPSSYLLGVTAGVVVVPGASIGALGVEGELYFDRLSRYRRAQLRRSRAARQDRRLRHRRPRLLCHRRLAPDVGRQLRAR